MATNHFSWLWAEMVEDLPEAEEGSVDLREMAQHFYEAGRAFAQTEIRQALIAEAERIENEPVGQVDRLACRGDALRRFAAGLIGLKEGS
jgi:hypothetical protein